MVSKRRKPPQAPRKRHTVKKEPPAAAPSQIYPGFPIVGIGASAGGLEALEMFFSHVTDDCGMAFIIVQHLDPTHKSILGSLLQKYTSMNISEISDGATVNKNRIYIAPPDHNIAIIDKTLQYLPPERVRGVNLPIDFFFRSLAEDQQERAIGIVLSGTGTDGTAGIKAIKGAGGMVMVQQESQARYSGMPRSAIDTGLVDFVLPVEEMPEKIVAYTHHPYMHIEPRETAKGEEGNFYTFMQKVLLLIRSKTGHDFSLYKQTTIRRRIERRMALHQMVRMTDYVQYLNRNHSEVESLFKELLINVTRFFRDPEAFKALEEGALGAMLDNKNPDQPIRIWVPGCSTGEEAYSLAILFTEAMERRKRHFNVQIFASDIDAEAIEFGRKGVYPESIGADVSQERLQRFFTKQNTGFAIKKSIRESVIFALQDLARDPPFSRLDLISCRNVLIYMDQVLQKKILTVLQYALIEDGYLFLGTSESIGEFTDSFTSVDSKWKIYKHKGLPRRLAEFPRFPDNLLLQQPEFAITVPSAGFRMLGEKVLAQSFAPPSVLVNERFDVLYTYGPINHYLAIPAGMASLNLLHIAREGLHQKLDPALKQALTERRQVISRNLRVRSDDGVRSIDVIVKPVFEKDESQRMMMVVFSERPAKEAAAKHVKTTRRPARREEEIETLEQELKATKDYLQNTIEELQTANEEFQSSNEELQSTNEELETSKEELQSTNEELVTVNSELQHKVDQLTETSNDISNLFSSTDIGTIFLDLDLRIRRFTPAMARIFRLQDTDTGRSLRDITSMIVSFDIFAAATDVLATLSRKEIELRTEDGRWYSLRIFPYRTADNLIDGVVLTFADITELKRLSIEAVNARKLSEGIVATIHDAFVVLNEELEVESANERFYTFFKVAAHETIHRKIYDLGNGQWDIESLKTLLEKIIPSDSVITDYIVAHDFPVIGYKTMKLNAQRIPELRSILLAFTE